MENRPTHGRHRRHLKKRVKQILKITLVFAVIVAILPFSAWLVNGRSASENRHIDKLSENFKPDSSDGNADRLAEANVFLTKYKTDINQNKIVAATETGSDYLLATSPEKSMDYGPVHVLTYDSSNQADKAAADLQSKKIPASSADVEFHVALGSNSGQVYPYQMQTQAKRTAGNKADEPLIALIDTGDDNADKSVNLTRESDADRNGHGTRMDKLIREGAGKEVQILSIKAFSDEGTANLSDMAAALCYAVDSGADIINISATAEATQHGREVLQVLVDEAFQKGITIVAAAGNSSADAVDYMPACLNHVITVGAADETGKLSSYSNYGKNVDLYVKGEKYTSSAAAKITGYIAGSSEAALSSHQDITVKAKGIQTEKNGFPASADPASEPEAKNTKASDAVDTASAETESTPAVEEKAEESADPDPDEDNKSEASAESESISFEEVPAEETTVLDKDTREESTIEPEEKKQTMDESAGKDNEKPIENAEATDDKETDQSSETEKSALPADTAAPAGAQENDDDEFKVNDDGGQKHATGYIENLDDDDEYIEMFRILEQEDGLAPFDSSDDAGYDSGIHNGIVRTNDSVDYTLQFTSAPYTDGAYYRNGYIRFKFILPNITPDQAEFATEEMSWMVSGTGTDYDYNVSSSTLDGKPVQILTCAMKLSADASGVANVLPCVKQTAFVRVRVKDMKSGSTLTPKFYCWMDHNTIDGACSQHGKQEVAEVTAAPTTISARPAYDVSIGTYPAVNSYKTLDFNKGTPDSPNYGKGNIYGAWFTVCTGVMMRNTGDSQRGLRGIEYPTGDITFDIELTPSYYQESTKKTLTDAEFTSMIQPYVYYADLHKSGAGANYGRNASVSGLPFDQSNGIAPYGIGNTYRACYDGGKVTCSQDGNIIHVTIKDYKIDGHYFPYANEWNAATSSVYYDYHNYGKGGQYTNYGFFSTQDYAIGAALDYDAVEKKFGEGSLQLAMTVKNAKFHSVNGESGDIEARNNKVMSSIPVRSKGVYDNNVFFEGFNGSDQWEPNRWSAQKADCIGSKVILHWGMTLHNYNKAYIYGFDSLVKFDAKAFTPTGEIIGGQNYQMHFMFAAKKDGTDWSNEEEKEAANIADMDYFSSYKDLVASGKKCVGFLTSARTYARHVYTEQYYSDGSIPVIINTNDGVAGNAYHIVEVSNVYCYEEGSQPANLPFYDEYLRGKNLAEPTQKDFKRHYVGSVWEDGEYKSGGNHAMDTGDTLYVMSYMAKITKHVEQTSDNAEKTLFNLDNGEKIVDYMLQPSILSKLPQGIKSDLTITDVIPKGMVYNNDSVYDGTYIAGKTSGVHGSVDGGTAIQPSSITTDNKGQTVITWIMKNVDLSSEIPAIHYSATIDTEKAVNNQSYTNTVIIRGQGDKRAVSETAGNYAYSTIKVVKLSGFSLTKLSDKEIYEIPDDISWTMTWNNLSKNAEPDILMMDMMPYNGDSFGSNYHGSYTVKSLKLDLDTPSAYTFWYTTDESYRSKSTRDITSDDVRANWAQGNIASDGTVSCLNGKTPVAWGFIGTLNGNTSLVGHITIQTTGAKADDDYYNESSMMKAVVSGHSAYVSHNLSGYVFIDTDKDGFKDDTETVLKDVTATLYEKGNHTKPVTNIDGKPCVTTTDDKGYYEFTNIAKRDYDVVFTKNDLSLYTLTPKYTDHEGWTNKATNEDDNNGLAKDMYIDSAIDRSLEAQQRDVLSRITYRVDYTQVNLGVYQRASKVMIQKTDTNGSILPGAKLQITDVDGHVLADWTSSKDPFTWTLTWGKTYTVTETKAPAGHALTAGSVSIQINKNGKLVVNGKAVDGYKITLADADTLHILSTGGSGTAVFALTGSILIFVAALQILSRRKKNLQA